MAIAAVTPASVGTQVFTYTWAAMASGDTGAPVNIVDFADKSIHFSGTFGTTPSIQWEGSNVAAPGAGDWVVLHDPSHTTIVKTAAGAEAVLEHMLWMRPNCTAGTGNAIVPILMARRGSR